MAVKDGEAKPRGPHAGRFHLWYRHHEVEHLAHELLRLQLAVSSPILDAAYEAAYYFSCHALLTEIGVRSQSCVGVLFRNHLGQKGPDNLEERQT